MGASRRTYRIHVITNNDHHYEQILRSYLQDYLQNGGTLPRGIVVPKGCKSGARRVLRELPGGDVVDVTEVGGCLTREVWFLVSEEEQDA